MRLKALLLSQNRLLNLRRLRRNQEKVQLPVACSMPRPLLRVVHPLEGVPQRLLAEGLAADLVQRLRQVPLGVAVVLVVAASVVAALAEAALVVVASAVALRLAHHLRETAPQLKKALVNGSPACFVCT